MVFGLTSVTFRQLNNEEIINAAVSAGLAGIEWGGDIHCPPGDVATAKKAARLTKEAGLRCLSYGSYFTLGEDTDFTPVLQSAQALQAPVIRIWAGTKPPGALSDADYSRLAKQAKELAASAAEVGIKLAFEYHRDTATETAQSTLRLLKECGLQTYWQPNPDLTVEANERELALIRPHLCYVHMFHWLAGNIRRPLAEGSKAWEQYLRQLGKDKVCIFEFVREDAPAFLLEDAAFIKKLASTVYGD